MIKIIKHGKFKKASDPFLDAERFTCEECSCVFESDEYEHFKNHHSEVKMTYCPECLKGCVNRKENSCNLNEYSV